MTTMYWVAETELLDEKPDLPGFVEVVRVADQKVTLSQAYDMVLAHWEALAAEVGVDQAMDTVYQQLPEWARW